MANERSWLIHSQCDFIQRLVHTRNYKSEILVQKQENMRSNLLFLIFITVIGTIFAKIDELCPKPINSRDKPNTEEKHCECITENTQDWGEQKLVINCNEMNIEYLNGSVENLPEHSVSLDLSYNQLTQLPFFDGADLKVLDASYNSISIIYDANFAGLANLKHLILSRNNITLIGTNAFEGLDHLTELDLRQNEIKALPADIFLSLPALNHLTLSQNPGLGPSFANVGADLYKYFGANPNLQTLYIEGCGLTKIDLGRGVGLRNLYIAENNLTELCELPSGVHILDMSMNAIETLEPGFIPPHLKVQMLLLQDMPQLKSIGAKSLANLPELNHLSFKGSMKLEEISEEAFGSEETTSKLEILNLQGAKLKTWPASLSPALKNLKAFDLEGNPLECDCEIGWINGLGIETNAQCEEPSNLKGVLLSGVPENKLKCRLFPRWVYATINSFLIVLVLVGCSLLLAFVVLKLRRINQTNRHKVAVGHSSPYAPVTTQLVVRPNSAYN